MEKQYLVLRISRKRFSGICMFLVRLTFLFVGFAQIALSLYTIINLQYLNMLTTQLNPAQLNVLNLMTYIDTEQEQQELQDILLEFYRKKADKLLLQFQKENNITQQTLDEWANLHERTPYGNR